MRHREGGGETERERGKREIEPSLFLRENEQPFQGNTVTELGKTLLAGMETETPLTS